MAMQVLAFVGLYVSKSQWDQLQELKSASCFLFQRASLWSWYGAVLYFWEQKNGSEGGRREVT